MKIVYCSSPNTAPWLNVKYAQALADGGADVVVLSTRWPPEEYQKGMIRPTVPIRHFPRVYRSKTRRFRGIPFLRYFYTLVSLHPDLYVAGDPDDLRLASIAAKWNGARVAYVPFEYYPGASYASPRLARRWKRLELLYSNRITVWISGGDKVSEEIRKVYRLGDRVHTIYNGWPRAWEIHEPKLRRAIHTKPGTRIVLYQGGIAKIRGVYDVLEAMTMLPEEVHFVVLGMGEIAAFREAVEVKALRHRVHVLDAVPQYELMDYTCEADIGIIPIHEACESYRFANPGKLFEYMAGGLALAVSRLEQMEWYVKNNGLGEVFEPGSPPDIARALMRLLADDAYRERCARNSKNIHESEACWEIQAEKLRRIVLGEGHHRSSQGAAGNGTHWGPVEKQAPHSG